MRYLLFMLLLTGCALENAEVQTEALGESGGLRIMAANITSGNYQNYNSGEGIRIFQGTRPDVVLIQEFNYGDNSSTAIRQFVDTAFGPSFAYYREGGAQIPNGIVSRYPIVASGEWDDPYIGNRDFAWARIDVPGSRDLWAVSVHLYSGSSTTRNYEAASIVEYVRANVPAEDYVVIGGDFNTSTRTELLFSTIAQVVDVAGPFPVDQLGNANTNATRYKPYDHVLVDADLRPSQVPTVFGASTFAAGLVVDTRVYAPIEEIAPALTTDSAGAGMQHMAVIKDFVIVPEEEAPHGEIALSAPNGGERWDIGTTQRITWTSSGVSDVLIEYTTDGTTWHFLADAPAAAGSVEWTVPAPASEAVSIRVSDVDLTTFDAADAAFAIVGTPRVFMNEILANELGTDTTREHVELVNSGTGSADVSRWTISDAIGVRYVFPDGTTLAPGRAHVVIAALALSNSGDTVTIRDASGAVVDAFTYGSALSGYDGVAMNRSPDGACGATFVLHTQLSGMASSPGTRVDGTAF